MKKQASPSAMNSRRHNVSDDPQTIRRRSSRLSADELLLNIPIDLIMDIFSRLPLKSIARYYCVSKRWASVLRRPDFSELFFTKSLASRKVLFACQKKSKVTFFSSVQPQNHGENLSHITGDHRITFRVERVYDISSPVNGFVCIRDYRILKRKENQRACICDM
ncbi:unnamed protein product [Brassica napus]|uniref:(rape) hypothetical protein n=1 Tax=Brassica napus TaxID=3708 RepID=A0A816JJF9_BRANA|nr:unnamed protein product [Brassica napus]